MKKNNRKKKIIAICILSVLIVCGIVFIILFDKGEKKPVEVIKDIVINKVIEEKGKYDDLIDLYKANKEINDDYVGQLYFDSELLNLPIVQGATNNTYMRTDWQTMNYDIGGTCFMDASNDFEYDQNVIIYGHNYGAALDPEFTKMFTPLRKLKDKANYEDNKTINFFTGDKLYKYEVIACFNVRIVEEDGIQYIDENEPIYVIRNYTNDEYNDYISKVKNKAFYDTGVYTDCYDRYLTLQTCIDDSLDKLIVLSKLVDEIEIVDERN